VVRTAHVPVVAVLVPASQITRPEPLAGERFEGFLRSPPVPPEITFLTPDRYLAGFVPWNPLSVVIQQRHLVTGGGLSHASGFDLPILEGEIADRHARLGESVRVLRGRSESLLAPPDGVLVEGFTRGDQYPEVDVPLL